MTSQLEWEASSYDDILYDAGGYFIFQYTTGSSRMYRLEGHGLDVINADIDELKRRAQADHDRRRQHEAWQRYMETHDPPDEDLLINARISWQLGDLREALKYLFRALTGVTDDDAS